MKVAITLWRTDNSEVENFVGNCSLTNDQGFALSFNRHLYEVPVEIDLQTSVGFNDFHEDLAELMMNGDADYQDTVRSPEFLDKARSRGIQWVVFPITEWIDEYVYLGTEPLKAVFKGEAETIIWGTQ